MPRAPKQTKREAHRPVIPIDWKKVDELLEAGCTGTEIAPALGVCADTLYDRTELEKGVTFSVYSAQKKSSGDALLKKAQFDKALGRTELGDNTMLVWLGKVRLEQRETTSIAVTPETEKNFKSIMEELADLQKGRKSSE